MTALLACVLAIPSVAAPWPDAHAASYLGVQITEVTPQRASALNVPEGAGAVIIYVDRDGPACHAGLLENDVIVGYDGSKVESPQQLQALIHATAPQKTVTLNVVRAGQRKDVKVTLGSWNVSPNANMRSFPVMGLSAPPLPPKAYPDIEIPSFTLLSERYGLVVESLSPQLADFFGVQRGQGVLVRSVEGGSAAASAGLKAGDIILKVNNDSVHDMSDWQRGMRNPGKKMSIVVWRDRKQQNLTINVPGSGDTSSLFGQRSETLAQLDDHDTQQMREEIQKAIAQRQKDIERMSRELAKSAGPSAKDMEQLRQQIQQGVPNAKQLADMRSQILSSMPTQEQMQQMQGEIDKAMKELQPQLQQQMDQLKKQMEQHQLDLQQLMKDFGNDQQP